MTDWDRQKDYQVKLDQLRKLIHSKGFFGLWITTVVNFAWLTGGGRSFVNIASENAVGKILVTPASVLLVTTNNELDRLLAEELIDLGISPIVHPWFVTFDAQVLAEHGVRGPIASDRDLAEEISLLRSQLTAREAGLIRMLGQASAEIVESCCWEIAAGEKEYEIAGRLSKGFWQAGIEPLVLNIAADDRAFRYRHPIPTDKRANEHLAISICARKWGLHVTLTRMIHFGSLPVELKRKHLAATQIEATAIAASKPGASVKSILDDMLHVYQATGFPDEWQ
jgi:Xaa-Pro aminopeptidase